MKTKHVIVVAIAVLTVLVIAYLFGSTGWEGIKKQNDAVKQSGRAH